MSSHDKINITIRPVGNGGFGIPVYVDMGRGNVENSSGHYSEVDPILGIIIGTGLSILCIFGFLWIILRNRGCSKQRRNLNQNRPVTPNLLQQQQQQPHSQPTLCNTDLHEMQTLIAKTELPSIIPNGVDKHNNTADAMENIYSTIDDDDDDEKNSNKSVPEVIIIPDDLILENALPKSEPPPVTVNGTKQNGIKTHYANLNGAATIHQNGSTIKSTLPPPHPSKHSISKSPLKTNGNLRITENPQYLIEPKQNAAAVALLFDDSQQILIDTSIDSIISNIDKSLPCIDDDDDEINMGFNESNLSTKPLHSSINYMRQIVGPNG